MAGRKVEASESGSERIALKVDQPVTLTLENHVGSAVIWDGASGDIRVDYIKTTYGETLAEATAKLSQIEVHIETDGDRVRVYTTDHTPHNSAQASKVDFEITVPGTINLIVKQDVGIVRVADIHSPETLRVMVKAGEIVMSDVNASNNLRLSADTGTIDFDGTLAGSGDISTKIGAVRLELPPDAAIRVDARTKLGSITVSDFDTSNVQNVRQMVSERWRGTLGHGEVFAALTVQVDTGDISISAG